MRLSISSSIAVLTLAALAVAAGTSPAEARGGPSKGPRGKDTTPPTLTVPSDITTGATALFGAGVTFTVTATDDKDPAPVVTVSPPSGSTFRIGTTTVTATATDWKGNSTTETFDVTVTPYTGGDRTYKAYFSSFNGAYFEWDITVAADGTVSGTGVQTGLLVVYDDLNEYVDVLPSGLSGAGNLSGTIATDGSCTFTSSHDYWFWDEVTYDAAGDPVYFQDVGGFSGASTGYVDSSGNLYFWADPLTGHGSSGIWFRQ